MNKFFITLAGAIVAALMSLPAQVMASEHALPLQFRPDPGNLASVQRGARNYMAYCSGCHSMKHLRYSRMGHDLGIPDELLKANLMFTSEKTGDPILSAMPAQASETWFGKTPPDLTVETRMRGPDWVYNYLMTFYVDASRPNGVNNLVLPGVSMPAVLWELQGWQVKPAAAAESGESSHEGHGEPGPGRSGLELVQPGSLSPAEFSKFVADTVNFMVYAAEPGRADRIALGIKVMLFLILFTILAYLMKREWWKDVH